MHKPNAKGGGRGKLRYKIMDINYGSVVKLFAFNIFSAKHARRIIPRGKKDFEKSLIYRLEKSTFTLIQTLFSLRYLHFTHRLICPGVPPPIYFHSFQSSSGPLVN